MGNQVYTIRRTFRGYGRLWAHGLLDRFYIELGEYIRLRCKYPFWDRSGAWHPIHWIFDRKK